MRALYQRVKRARVTVEGETAGEIGAGGVVLLGVSREDGEAEARKLAEKVARLRVFDDEGGTMNRALESVEGGALLVVSQFTLYGDTRKGNRPSWIRAAGAEQAERLYGVFVEALRGLGVRVETGRFRTHMEVELVNDGPVTLLLETEGK